MLARCFVEDVEVLAVWFEGVLVEVLPAIAYYENPCLCTRTAASNGKFLVAV